ncbi:guanylate kinase [Streptomyces sp. NBC_00038]|uniref:guanylate kinase n=1 Tax=Streptomyces sp. NBC_00038 TaxID=2903615 RepID=UPI0022565DF4|nr:guanylate kinase [Streptomyces sp. NBC_00038]MCX5555404.1 guanylate kinase [Streptomyces sp. NBC_00038]
MNQGVLLYGPPASGKDTVTAALSDLNALYTAFTRLKVGTGKTQGYRMGTPQELADLEGRGDVLYSNARYGNVYVVDRPGLALAMEDGRIPILHLGQVTGIEAVANGYPAAWSRVLLWCSREVTAARSKERGDCDSDARLAAWDATERDLTENSHATWDLRVDTEANSPAATALQIDRLIRTPG